MTNNTTAPLPDNCPFCCGHAAPCLTSSHRTGVFVYCLSCLASTNDFDTKEEALAAWKMRQPTQSDALREAVIEECANALEADAMKCDCAALEERECGCGAWCEWKSITSARAVEIVRALQEQGK